MNTSELLMTVLAVALGAMTTRFSPFLLFPEHKKTPDFINYLGGVLPPAMMGLLVVYCLKDVSLFHGRHGIPELLAIAFIVIIHKWKNNVLLSIGGGTFLYMLLIRFLPAIL